MSQSEIDNLSKLFAEYKGDVIMSSSTPGQTSGCMVLNDKVIDVFTGCIAMCTEAMMSGEVGADWDDLLDTLKGLVAYVSDVQRDEEQTVQYIANVNQAGRVNANKTQQQACREARQEAREQAPKPAPQKQDSEESATRLSTTSTPCSTCCSEAISTTIPALNLPRHLPTKTASS